MLIYTVWVSDGSETDDAWMADAWDEFTKDNNEQGFEKCVSELEAKHSKVVVVPISVSWRAIENRLSPPAVPGTVDPST